MQIFLGTYVQASGYLRKFSLCACCIVYLFHRHLILARDTWKGLGAAGLTQTVF